MQHLQWRVRVSTLWVVLAVGMSAHTLMALFEPGIIEDLMEGSVEGADITTGFLVFVSLFWIVPLLMAFLGLVLRGRVNRVLNAAAGLVVTVMWAWELIELLSGGFGAIALVVGGMVAAGLAIIWHAWRWPESEGHLRLSEERAPVSAGSV